MHKKIRNTLIYILITFTVFIPVKKASAEGFFDKEKIKSSVISTVSLDLGLESTTDNFIPSSELFLGDSAKRKITIKNLGSLNFFYNLSTINESENENCQDLEIEIYKDDNKIAKGHLGETLLNSSKTNEDYFLENGEKHKYIFKLKIPDENNEDYSDLKCEFDIFSEAWMEDRSPGEAFYDEENLTSEISTLAWKMEMGFETAETLKNEEDGNPPLGFCSVLTQDKSQNNNTAALQIIKWSEIESAEEYRITEYKKDDENNWTKQGDSYNPDDNHNGINIKDGIVEFKTWVSKKGIYAYFIEALDSEGKVIGQTLPKSDNFNCTFTVWWPGAGDLLINEIMWSGSTSIQQDYWIELYNTTDKDITLKGWRIESAGPSFHEIELSGVIPAGEYYLLSHYETDYTRGNNNFAAIKDRTESGEGFEADLVTKKLLLQHQVGEQLTLFFGADEIIDQTPIPEKGKDKGWAEGEWNDSKGVFKSMQRKEDGEDGTEISSWVTCMHKDCNSGKYWDEDGGPNYGTPKSSNLFLN